MQAIGDMGMTIEYWLQKKTLSGWTNVTWYAETELETAKRSYNQLLKNKGYCYRMVKVEVIECHMLEEVTEIKAPEIEEEEDKKNVWAGQSNDWGNVSALAKDAAMFGTSYMKDGVHIPAETVHGMSGKVWLIHHGKKEKKRVDPSAVDAMIADGWERGGPKTAFR